MSDNSRFVSDITIPDDMVIEPGTEFVKTWRLQNSGATTWDAGYSLVFVNGSHMGQTAVAVPRTPPGQTVDISVKFTTPDKAGKYFGDWQMQNAQGQRFGELFWLRIVVPVNKEMSKPVDPPTNPPTIPATTPPPEISAEFNPAAWRNTIWAMTSIFESGSPEGNPSAYQTYDSGLISYGKHQATLASGTLGRVVQAYLARSSSSTAQALHAEYGSRITKVNPPDKALQTDGRLKQLLLMAATEPEMSDAQDAVFDDSFYRPAIVEARNYNVQSPLGLAALYDTNIQGGLYIVLPRVTERLGGKIGDVGHNGQVITESIWIGAFLDLREERLNRLADQFEQKGDPNNAKWLRVSAFRVQEHRKLLQAGNLMLRGPFTVRGQQVPGIP